MTEFAFQDFDTSKKAVVLNAKQISDALAECQTFLQETDYVERYSFVRRPSSPSLHAS